MTERFERIPWSDPGSAKAFERRGRGGRAEELSPLGASQRFLSILPKVFFFWEGRESVSSARDRSRTEILRDTSAFSAFKGCAAFIRSAQEMSVRVDDLAQ